MKPKMRLQKYIAECGVASRRQAEKLILSGQVKVNGKIIMKLGASIDPKEDKVEVGAKTLKNMEDNIYIKFNKPRGVVSSCRSFGEKTILDYVKEIPCRLFPVGRLDKDSEGLMLLTNDGDLANRLMHPRYEHEKEYIIDAELRITNVELKKIENGIIIDGKKTLPAQVDQIGPKSFCIILKEGKKRQIRRMVEAAGNRVRALKRIRIGKIKLGDLPLGEYERLTAEEIKKMLVDTA